MEFGADKMIQLVDSIRFSKSLRLNENTHNRFVDKNEGIFIEKEFFIML